MKFLLLSVFSAFALSSLGQNAVTDSSTVLIHKDPRVDLLVKKHAQINEDISKNRRSMRGYRLMVINTNKRDEAMNAKTKMYTYFPELKSYLYYQSPYFRVKAGNFRDRKEAEDYQKKLKKFFPKGVYIVPDVIELRPEETPPNP